MPRQIAPSVGFASAEPTESTVFGGRPEQSPRAACRPTVAVRRRCPAPRGRARPQRTTSLPAIARTQPRPHFPISPSPSSAEAKAAAAEFFPRLRRARLRSPPPIHHHSNTTSSPATHRVHLCPLLAPGKLQRHASARWSSAATLRRRGPT